MWTTIGAQLLDMIDNDSSIQQYSGFDFSYSLAPKQFNSKWQYTQRYLYILTDQIKYKGIVNTLQINLKLGTNEHNT